MEAMVLARRWVALAMVLPVPSDHRKRSLMTPSLSLFGGVAAAGAVAMLEHAQVQLQADSVLE